jgi:hypothetical protein
VATEHNRQVDYHTAAVRQGVRDYFTPVVGNEVTTEVGHFNIFPVPAGERVPDHRAKEWKDVFAGIAERTAAPVVILNHPRDLHAGFRPFGPEHHLALTGENLDGWELRASGMEVINSGAQQTDVLRPYRDWFGLLNRGLLLTPVGASDSHDVSRSSWDRRAPTSAARTTGPETSPWRRRCRAPGRGGCWSVAACWPT